MYDRLTSTPVPSHVKSKMVLFSSSSPSQSLSYLYLRESSSSPRTGAAPRFAVVLPHSLTSCSQCWAATFPYGHPVAVNVVLVVYLLLVNGHAEPIFMQRAPAVTDAVGVPSLERVAHVGRTADIEALAGRSGCRVEDRGVFPRIRRQHRVYAAGSGRRSRRRGSTLFRSTRPRSSMTSIPGSCSCRNESCSDSLQAGRPVCRAAAPPIIPGGKVSHVSPPPRDTG